MFAQYLKSYFTGYEFVAGQQPHDPRYKCLLFIANAETENVPVYLGRIFNEFPLEYQNYFPAAIEKTQEWATALDTAIKKTHIKEEKDSIVVHIEEDAQTAIKEMVFAMAAVACKELFADNGALKSEIVTTLGLQSVINKWQDDLARSTEMDYQILYSYCVQILFGKTMLTWHQASFEKKHDDRSPALVAQFIEKLFAEKEDIYGIRKMVREKKSAAQTACADQTAAYPWLGAWMTYLTTLIKPKSFVQYFGFFADKPVESVQEQPVEHQNSPHSVDPRV